MTRDKIIARLKSTEILSQERANLEFALWETMTPEQKADALKSYDGLRFAEKGYHAGGMAFHLKVILNVPYQDLIQRSILRCAGDDAAMLWEHIDAGLVVTNTAYRLLRDARKMSANTETVRPVKDVLSELLASSLPKVKLQTRRVVGVEEIKHNEIISRLRAETLPSRERADLELALWELATQKQREDIFSCPGAAETIAKGYVSGGLTFYVKTLLNENYEDVAVRSILRRAKDDISVLWKYIDANKLVMSVACRIYRQARKICDETKRPIEVILSDLLTEYDALPLRTDKDGKTYRIKSQYSLQKSKRTGPNRRSKKKKSAEESDRTFWFKIKDAMADLADSRLEGIEAHIAEKLIKELEADLAILTENFGNQVRKFKNQGSLAEMRKNISRKRILNACDALVMNPPKPDKPVDEILAKKRWKSRARVFHPDANGGKEHLLPQYQAVMDAYKLLLEYNEQLAGKKGEPSNELQEHE